MDGDWDVDGPSVIKGMEPQSILTWMADPHRQQPIMADDLDEDA